MPESATPPAVESVSIRVPIRRAGGYASRTLLSLQPRQAETLRDVFDGMIAAGDALEQGGRHHESALRQLLDLVADARPE